MGLANHTISGAPFEVQVVLAELVDQVAARPVSSAPDGLRPPGRFEADAARWAENVAAVAEVMGRQTWQHRYERDIRRAHAAGDPAELRAALLAAAGTLVSWVVDLDGRPPAGGDR